MSTIRHDDGMSDIERRRSNRPSRRQREQRAYRLVLATGGFGLLGVVGIVLAIAGVIGSFWPIVFLVIAAVCGLLVRRTVN
jgi:hypothetical protein